MKREKLENFLWHAVELEDFNKNILNGWFVKDDKYNLYILLPLNDIWHTYIFRASYIKRIKFLINGYETK